MKREDFQRIFKASFDDDARWERWFFDNVAVNDSEILAVADTSGKTVATLLMQPYAFLYQGAELPSGYISCVATLPEYRGRGKASALMEHAIAEAAGAGYAAVELIPARDDLYFFYRRFGFATVFYMDQMRYTSLHVFSGPEGTPVEPTFELLHRLEMANGCGVLHSAADFRNILADMSLDGGAETVAVDCGDAGSALLFATYNKERKDSEVTVKSLLADSAEAAEACLGVLRSAVGERAFRVLGPPLSGEKAFLRCRGMLRIVDVRTMLAALAAAHPRLSATIAVTDRLLAANNATYSLADGKCTEIERPERPDLDVSVEVLAGILFSSHRIGEIFNLPARRPYMALMLD